MEKKRLSLKLILLAVLALALLCQSLYLLTHSNGNLGVALVWGLTAFVWALLIFHRPLAAFAATGPGRVVCWVLGLGFGLFFALLAFVALSGYSNQPKGNEKAMVVLGAAVHGSKVSRLLRYRLDAACDYYFQHPDLVIVTTGGQGRGEDLPEGRAMRDYLIAKGVPADKVFAEEKSTSTEENFLFAAEILEEQGISRSDPILLVTNAFHCYRAAEYGRMAGFETVTALPAGISPGSVLPSYFREVFALLYYWVFKSSQTGWIHPLVGTLDAFKRGKFPPLG